MNHSQAWSQYPLSTVLPAYRFVSFAPRAGDFALDAPFLGSFSHLLVPRHLWQAMSHYAAWIEPALLNEWTELMQGYEGDAWRTHDEHFTLLR